MIYEGKNLLGEKTHTLKVAQYIIQISIIDYKILVEQAFHKSITH